MAPAAPLVWLQATESERLDPLRVLAAELAGLHDAPVWQIAGPDQVPRAADLPGAGLIVLAGDVLPVDLIAAARAAGTGLLWVEAGATPRLDRRHLLPGRPGMVVRMLDRIHAIDAGALPGLQKLARGRVPIEVRGRLARLPRAMPCNALELAALRAACGGRPVWFAYSLPAAEFDAALAAQVVAMRQAHRLLLVAAPRDPREGADLAGRAEALGLTVARRLADDEIDENVQLYIADAEDPPGLFLRLAPVTYLGGTLTPGIDAPPAAEAAALGSALIFGPERRDPVLTRLRDQGAGRSVLRPGDLGGALAALLVPETCARAALAAWTLATEGSEATLALARDIRDWLAATRGRAGPAGGRGGAGAGTTSRANLGDGR